MMAARAKKTAPTLYTIGHSTRTIGEFIALLQAHGIEAVADIRTVPKSRHNPQFEERALARSLAETGITYTRIPELGGLRRAKQDSKNLGWRNASFRGYADHMQSAEFARGIELLKEMAMEKPVAIMCAEAVPWRCHRSLVADAMVKKEKWRVLDIMSEKSATSHRLTPFLKYENGQLWYPKD